MNYILILLVSTIHMVWCLDPCVFESREDLDDAVESYFTNNNTYANCSIENWNIDKIEDLSGLFKDRAYFNGDITTWNTTRVLNMSQMFRHANRFNQDISSWNVENVNCLIIAAYGASLAKL